MLLFEIVKQWQLIKPIYAWLTVTAAKAILEMFCMFRPRDRSSRHSFCRKHWRSSSTDQTPSWCDQRWSSGRQVEKSSTWAWEHWRPSRTRRSPSSRCCRRRRLWREQSTWSQRMSNLWRERLPCPRRIPPSRSGRWTHLWVSWSCICLPLSALVILGKLGIL